MNTNINSRLLFLATMGLSFLFSCKKTETIGVPPLPQDRILEYKVVNVKDTVIYGIIDNIENNVIVYVPYYHALEVIQPEITVQPGATLDGEVLPVLFSEPAPNYTVRGADGSSRTYNLKITQQNPESFSVSFYSSPQKTIKARKAYPNSSTNMYGDLYSTSAATLKAKLTHQRSGKAILLDDLFHQKITPGANSYWFSLPIPADVDTGYYDVEIGFLGNTSKVPEPREVAYREPLVTTAVTNVTKGGLATFKAAAGRILFGATKVTVTIKGTEYELPVIRENLLEIEVRASEDLPVGKHGICNFNFSYAEWPSVVKQNISFTVLEANESI